MSFINEDHYIYYIVIKHNINNTMIKHKYLLNMFIIISDFIYTYTQALYYICCSFVFIIEIALHMLLINVMIKHKLFINNENKTYYINA